MASQRWRLPNANPYSDSHGDCNSNRNSHGNCDSYGNCDANAADANANNDRDANTLGDPSSADAVSEWVKELQQK